MTATTALRTCLGAILHLYRNLFENKLAEQSENDHQSPIIVPVAGIVGRHDTAQLSPKRTSHESTVYDVAMATYEARPWTSCTGSADERILIISCCLLQISS